MNAHGIELGDGHALAALLDEPPWQPSAEEVEIVRTSGGGGNACEYAAWTLTHAHRINHLTILQNALGIPELDSLAALNAHLQAEGFEFNAAGGSDGLTQGSPEKHLEQSSTLADQVAHTFSCGTKQQVSMAFLELIQRHEGYRGFLGSNARGIFDSTRARG